MKYLKTLNRLGPGAQLLAFANAHQFYGLHRTADGWLIREHAPNATSIFLTGDATKWQDDPAYEFRRLATAGDWELRLPAEALQHGQHYQLHLRWSGGEGLRLPAYARRVVQDEATKLFSAQVWDVPAYVWQHPAAPPIAEPPLIYEAHVGMAQERGGVGTYAEFRQHVLPRVIASGYNVLQLMAVMEHPYYGSFGYHVSNFFAPSSRFGTPEELKELIDAAHAAGLRVIMDLVHSHAVKNELEGLALFDGTPWLYFHDGPRGYHEAWDSRCFNYTKDETLRFLLSNCRYWLEEFRIDGFRFDGVTSMLFDHHGLGKVFSGYGDYFTPATDEDALVYLTLANRLIHEIRPQAMTIAEDVSGMPGLAAPIAQGGVGFDYRLAMGVPDLWFKLAATQRDEDWNIEHLYFELINRRQDEMTISYVESHDQSIVGGKTFFFQLADAAIYTDMHTQHPSLIIDRALALHKIARLMTLTTAGHGYLNFIGNEFGHPEWVDFPREGNGWSYHYSRRQWSLRDNPDLKYHGLAEFDQALIHLLGSADVLRHPTLLHYSHVTDEIVAYSRGQFLILVNLHPTESQTDYAIHVPDGKYQLVLDTDEARFCGLQRVQPKQEYFTMAGKLLVYLPSRCALVLEKMD
jgi:1,4-alpha-glucan branching enzyme